LKGHMQDGKFHPHTDHKKGVRKSRDQSSKTEGVRIKSAGDRFKKDGVKIKSHLFRIFSTRSTEFDGDRQETAHIRAKNLDEVIDFIKKDFFQKRVQNDLEVNGDDETAYITTTYATDEEGNELSQNEIEKIQEKEGEDAVGWVTEGFEAFQDDDEDDSFNTIYGGNDFYDLTKPKGEQSGFTTEDAIKKAGGVEKAFFSGSGRGFESGNPNNDFNLNNPNPVLFDPSKKQFKRKARDVKVGDTVEVYVSPDEPRRRIKITKILDSYKGDSEGGIEGKMKDGSFAWARMSQIKKLKMRQFK